jgi:hypothetical protein
MLKTSTEARAADGHVNPHLQSTRPIWFIGKTKGADSPEKKEENPSSWMKANES